MNPSLGQSAADLLRKASAEEMQGWFQNYGELPGSRRLAQAIAESREQQPLETNADLLKIIREAGIGRGRHHHPATLVFQALRIAVNDELGALEEGLGPPGHDSNREGDWLFWPITPWRTESSSRTSAAPREAAYALLDSRSAPVANNPACAS